MNERWAQYHRRVRNGAQPAVDVDQPNVRFGSLADISGRQRDVRFTPESRHFVSPI